MGVAHVLLLRWNSTAALAGAGLHAYGLLLLLAHLRAVRLRPVRLTENGELVLRVGFLWELRLPATDITACVANYRCAARRAGPRERGPAAAYAAQSATHAPRPA